MADVMSETPTERRLRQMQQNYTQAIQQEPATLAAITAGADALELLRSHTCTKTWNTKRLALLARCDQEG